jgi:hypothetical protein
LCIYLFIICNLIIFCKFLGVTGTLGGILDWEPVVRNIISYHIVSYHIISYIISYHIAIDVAITAGEVGNLREQNFISDKFFVFKFSVSSLYILIGWP